MERKDVMDQAQKVLENINQVFPKADLVVDEINVKKLEEMWKIRCQGKQFLQTGHIRDRLHAFPEPYLVIDDNDHKMYLCRDTDDSILLSDYRRLKLGEFKHLKWEIITPQIYVRLAEELKDLHQCSLRNKTVFTGTRITKEQAIKLVEQELDNDDYKDGDIQIVIDNIEDLGEVWFIGCESEKFLKTNKVQDMLLGTTNFLIDKESLKMYAIGAGNLDDILEDYLYHKYNWYSDMNWEFMDVNNM